MKSLKRFLTVAASLAIALSLVSCGDGSEGANLKFELNETGDGYALVGVENVEGTLEIPSKYKELPVTEIASEAFLDGEEITVLKLPDTLKVFGKSAFKGLTSLNTLYIEDLSKWCAIEFEGNNVGAAQIYTNPFAYAEEIYIDGVKTDKLVIPEGVTEIKGGAFAFSDDLFASVSLPSTLEKIGKDAFASMTEITELKIPASVTLIEENAFANCSELLEIYAASPDVYFANSPDSGCDKLKSFYFDCPKSEFKFSPCTGVNYYFTDGGIAS